MSYVEGTVGRELGSVPFGSMIKEIAIGIAEGQWALDKSSMVVAELMSGQRLLRDLDTGKLIGVDGQEQADGAEPKIIDSRVFFGYTFDPDTLKKTPQKLSMMELGFAPNFYQFVETIIEIKVIVNMVESDASYKSQTERVVVDSSTTTTRNSVSYGSRHWWRGSYYGRSSSQQKTDTMVTRSVDPAISTKYNYSVEGSASVRTKLVPIPPPAILEERIRELMDVDKRFNNLLFEKAQDTPADNT